MQRGRGGICGGEHVRTWRQLRLWQRGHCGDCGRGRRETARRWREAREAVEAAAAGGASKQWREVAACRAGGGRRGEVARHVHVFAGRMQQRVSAPVGGACAYDQPNSFVVQLMVVSLASNRGLNRNGYPCLE